MILRQAAVIPHVTCLVMAKVLQDRLENFILSFYIIVTVQNKLQTQSITSSDTPSNGLKHCKTLHQIGITRCPSVSVPPSLNSWLGLSLHFVLFDVYMVCQQSHYVGTVYCTIATLPHFTVLRMRES